MEEKYKDYVAQINFYEEKKLFYGEVLNIRDVITFQGQSIQEAQQAFQESVDEYIAWCEERNKVPEKFSEPSSS